MNARIMAMTLVSMLTSALFAADYTWVEGSTNWLSPSSYKDSAGNVQTILPTSIGTLTFTASQTLTVDDASVEFVSKIGNLKVTDGFVLDVNVANNVRMDCTMKFDDSHIVGTLRKRGVGTLQLGDKKSAYDYAAAIEVLAGTLRLPGNTSAYSGMRFGRVTVARDAVLYISSPGNFQPDQIFGEGLITCEAGKGVTQVMPQYTGASPASFAGTMSGNFVYFSPGHQYLTGENSTMANEFGSIKPYGYNAQGTAGIVGLSKLGNVGGASSAGTFKTLDFTDQGAGCILYLGDGETSDKGVRIQSKAGLSAVPHTFDAGARGGLTIGGEWTVASASMARFCLTGSNAVPCKITGPMSVKTDHGTNYTCYVTKSGSGAWHFACADNDLRGPIAVKEGTLLFDSLYEKGELSSLGRSTELWADAYGLQTTPVSYAFLLGSSAAVGSMETAGQNGVVSGTRPYELTGRGGRLCANTAVYKASGITAKSATTLYLSGDNTSPENVAAKISGPVGIVKEGKGTWTLDNELSFTGDLDVRAGTLVVRNSSARPFDWFRWTVKETAANCSRYKPLKTGGPTIHLREIVLMGADGKRQLVNATRNDSRADIAPGQVGYGRLPYPTSGSQHLEVAFTSAAGQSMNVGLSTAPLLNEPSTWVPMVVRLTNGAPEVVSFDLRLQWGWDGDKGNGDQYCFRSPTAYVLEGSCDGMNWTELLSDDAVDISKSGSYISTHEQTSSPISLATRAVEKTLNVLGGAGFVSVAGGAVLKAEGDAVTLKKLRVDAGSAGTLDGFALASDCCLDVAGELSGDRIDLPVKFDNVTGLDDVSGWTLTVGGQATRKYRLSSKDGQLSLYKNGFAIIIR